MVIHRFFGAHFTFYPISIIILDIVIKKDYDSKIFMYRKSHLTKIVSFQVQFLPVSNRTYQVSVLFTALLILDELLLDVYNKIML